MKEYIVGGYYNSADQIKTIGNDKAIKILDNLKDAYPNAKTPLKIFEDLTKEGTEISKNEIYKGIEKLQMYRFIHELNGSQRKEVIDKKSIQVHEDGSNYRARFFIVEQSDSTINLLSDKDPKKWPKYALAPGYVEYDEKFSKAWDVLLSKVLIKDDILGDLSSGFVRLLKTVLSITSENWEMNEVVPSTGSLSTICTNCGINHEGRSFLRAVMLKVLDYIEISSEYRDFLKEKIIIGNSGYEHYKNSSEYNDKILKSLSEEKILERQELKEEEHNRQVSPPGVVWMRIISMSKYRFHRTHEMEFLAFSNEGSYIYGTILSRLAPKNMKEGTLIEYTGPIKPSQIFPDEYEITMTEVTRMEKHSMRILQEDNGSIARRQTIPLDSISSIKENGKIYHVSGRILSKEKVRKDFYLEYLKIRIKDNSGDVPYSPGSDDAFSKVKVGDKIDVIGRYSLHEDGTVSLHPPLVMSGSDVIDLLDSNPEM